jgi:hypothetical protein
MYQNDAMKVLTGEVRLSYANLMQPRTPQGGGDPKYSVTLLIPKTDVKTKADIDQSIQSAIQEGIPKKWNGKQPALIHNPLHDGDRAKENGEPFGEECRGCWVISASSKQKPGIVDSSLQDIINPSDIYSGMYARVTIRFFAYDSNGKRGIGCGLGNVMKMRDGDALSGHASAKEDFADIAQAPTPASASTYPVMPGSTPNLPGPAQQYPAYAPQAPASPQYTAQPPADMPQGYPPAPVSGYQTYAPQQGTAPQYPGYPQQQQY